MQFHCDESICYMCIQSAQASCRGDCRPYGLCCFVMSTGANLTICLICICCNRWSASKANACMVAHRCSQSHKCKLHTWAQIRRLAAHLADRQPNDRAGTPHMKHLPWLDHGECDPVVQLTLFFPDRRELKYVHNRCLQLPIICCRFYTMRTISQVCDKLLTGSARRSSKQAAGANSVSGMQ